MGGREVTPGTRLRATCSTANIVRQRSTASAIFSKRDTILHVDKVCAALRIASSHDIGIVAGFAGSAAQ
jgi:hypothetical protein